jgi:hypothetical protein
MTSTWAISLPPRRCADRDQTAEGEHLAVGTAGKATAGDQSTYGIDAEGSKQ